MGIIDPILASTRRDNTADSETGATTPQTAASEPLMELTRNLSVPYSVWREIVIETKERGEQPALLADQLLSLDELYAMPETLAREDIE